MTSITILSFSLKTSNRALGQKRKKEKRIISLNDERNTKPGKLVVERPNFNDLIFEAYEQRFRERNTTSLQLHVHTSSSFSCSVRNY